MKFNLCVLGLVLILFSCTQEEDTLINSGEAAADLVADLSSYEGTALGMYKGVFTTNDSQERGVIEIQVINERSAKATLTLNSGEVINYRGAISSSDDTFRNSTSNSVVVQFRSLSGLDTFEFNVKEDGSSPSIRTGVHNDKPSFISVLKENTRNALITTTGTYMGSGFNETFSIVFDSQGAADGDTMNFTTQILVNSNDIGTSIGNAQTACSDDSASRTCNIAGVASAASGITLNWNGIHFSTIDTDCSQIDGLWEATGPEGTDFSGTFMSDIRCVGCFGMSTPTVGSTASEETGTNEIENNLTRTFNADVVTDGTIGVDSSLDNVTLDITHTFDGDLNISLTSPAGTTADLSTGVGGAGNNFTGTIFSDVAFTPINEGTAPFTGAFNAEGGPLNDVFDGESIAGTWILNIEDVATGDDGTLDFWSISFCDSPITLPPPPPPLPGCNGTTTDITGGGAGSVLNEGNCATPDMFTATSELTGTIGVDADIDNVNLNITHSFDGDLEISLISPTGTTLALSVANGGSGADYVDTVFRDGGEDITAATAPFTGEFQPQGGTFAAAFDGDPINGDWVLSVCDSFSSDEDGVLESWSISFCDENISGLTQEQQNSINARSTKSKALRPKVYKDRSAYQR